MSRLTRYLLVLMLLAIAGGTVFLVTWEIPPPSAEVEIVIPDERFQD